MANPGYASDVHYLHYLYNMLRGSPEGGDPDLSAIRVGNSQVSNANPVPVNIQNANPISVTGTISASSPSDLPVSIYFSDSALIDAFGRMRVSEPYTLFDSQMQYNTSPLFWETALVTGGSATHLPNEAAVRMRVDGTNGASVIRQTKRYFRYQPGKSQLILLTFVMGAAVNNIRKRVGYFDAQNGIYLEQTISGVRIVRRTYVSGTAFDNEVEQVDWNIDQMDGSGVSGINLNFENAQILYIDMEWLGVGRVRVGFVVNGLIYYAHEFLNTNVLSTVYMTTANLPLRYEITRTDGGVGNTDLYQICSSVASEGGLQEKNLVFGYTMKSSRTVSNTPLPILSIRLSSVFPGGGSLVNRETIVPLNYTLYTSDNPVIYWLIYNGALTNASFVNYDTTNSGAQFDISATAISGGIQVDSGGYVPTTASTRASVASSIESVLYLTNNIAGNSGDTITIVCQRAATNNAATFAGIEWKELY